MRRRRLSLTSLIDVIFLLLLFFMLSSSFARHAEIVLLAGSGNGPAAPQPPLFLRLDTEGLSLNGTPVTEPVAAAIARLSGDDTAPRVILSVTAGVTAQAMVDVLAPLDAIPGAAVTVVD